MPLTISTCLRDTGKTALFRAVMSDWARHSFPHSPQFRQV